MATLEELRAERERRRGSTTYGQASQSEYVRERLERLEASGSLSAIETRTLDALRTSAPQNQQAIGETGAAFRGLSRTGTAGLKDEAAGVFSFFGGDGYKQGRQETIEADRAARELFPGAFSSGEMAGGALLAGATLGIGGPAMTGKHILTKMIAGGAAGAGVGAMQGQSDFEMAGSPEGERMPYLMPPTAVGGSVGAAAYPVARGVGAAVKGLRNMRSVPRDVGYGAKPVNTITDRIKSTREAGIEIENYLGGLSDEAMLADVPGPLQGTAQGLAAMRGTGGSKLAQAVNQRGEAAGQRIRADVDQQIGGPNAAFDEQRRLASERTNTLGPEYEAALGAGNAVQVRPLLNQLDEAMRVAGPDTAPLIRKFAEDLRTKAPNGLIDPAQLHWIRSDLSDAMGSLTGPSKSNSIMQSALRDMDGVLDQVPGYTQARTGYGNNRAMERAIEDGQKALRGGRAKASSPAEFQAQFEKLSAPQKDAFRTGLRRDVAALMGTSRNDAAAAWGEFAKEWSEEKLRIALGDAAEPLIKRLRSENVFSQTRGKITGGSKTAEAQEQRDALGDYRDTDTNRRPGPLVRAKRQVDDVGNRLLDGLIYGNRASQRNDDLGKMLSLQGQERDDLFQRLLRYQTMKNRPSVAAERTRKAIEALLAGGGGATSAALGDQRNR